MVLDGKNLATAFDAYLAPYAQKNAASRGRAHSHVADPDRLPFQRDRDRILHTTAFRRLNGKMQVVSPLGGDHYRNRLTHTLEVAQIARDLARELRLNEDLAETVALAHDLGHPPFGHSGERALDKAMKNMNKEFDHNKQSLRVVTLFENRYRDFPGLNLSLEVLEGIQKHETFFDRADGPSVFSPHLESQLVDVADEVAYLSADLEDGLRGEFFTYDDLSSIMLCEEVLRQLPQDRKDHRPSITRAIVRRLFSQVVLDTTKNLNKYCIQSLEDVQKSKKRMVYFSKNFYPKFKELKNFLIDRYYSAPPVVVVTDKGEKMVADIFEYLIDHPHKIPEDFFPEEAPEQRVCDYIAGMTDRFAEEFYQSVVG